MDENGQCPTIELSDSIKELIEDRKIIKFGARVRDIDRQYEINNNADLDNGVYHKFDEDEENKPKSLMDEIGSSLGLEGFIKMQQELWGDNSSGCAEDEMPNGIGEFGIEPTNPIPVNTVELGSKKYLAGLRAEDGSKVNSERIGSQTVDNIEKPIDSYIITHEDGSEIATIYISPYQAKNSKKAPRGLKQVST